MRCRKCRQRFYAKKLTAHGVQVEKPAASARPLLKRHKSTRRNARLMRVLIAVAVFGVMFLIFFAFLRFLSNEHSSEENSATQSRSVVPSLMG